MCRFLLCALGLLLALPGLGWSADVQGNSAPAVAGGLQVFEPIAGDAPAGNAGMFVGICQFSNDPGLQSLVYATHDAIELAHLFVFELKLIPPQNCHLLLAGEAASETVKSHLEQLRRSGARIDTADRAKILVTLLSVANKASDPSQMLVCSFSSHGFEDRGHPYVMPSDGVRQLLADTAVSLNTIESTMQTSQAGHRLLLVDACQERISARSLGSNPGAPSSDAFARALQSPTGQAKLASCSSGEFSFEHGSLGGVGHGVFTYQFLQALRGGASADGQNIVRLGTVAEYVATNVTAWTTDNRRPKQTPFLQSPVETRRLPLAAKADDLATLIATVERHRPGGAFTVELRTKLASHLRTLRTAEGADGDLVSATRSFLSGQLPDGVFAGYLKADQTRWKTAPTVSRPNQLIVLHACRHGETCLEEETVGAGLFTAAYVAELARLRDAGSAINLNVLPGAIGQRVAESLQRIPGQKQSPEVVGATDAGLLPLKGQRLIAITIGVDRNADPKYPRLRFAASDARRVGDELRKWGADVRTLTGGPGDPSAATKANILRAIQTAIEQSPDVLFVHFSGNGIAHGSTKLQSLLPADGRLNDRESLLTLDELRAALSSQRGPVLLSIDACRTVLPAELISK